MQYNPDSVAGPTDDRLEHIDRAEFSDDPCAFYFRKIRPEKGPFILGRDFAETAMMAFAFLAVNVLPVSVLVGLRDLVGGIHNYTVRQSNELQLRLDYERVLGQMEDEVWANLRLKQAGQKFACRLAIAREFGPRQHDPIIDVTGLAPLTQALDQGKGAILWANRFTYYPVFSKRALFQEDISAFAVSNSGHGLSASRLAELTINKIQIAAENKYLAKRLVFRDGEETSVQKRALTSFKKGHPVIYTNSAHRGNRYVELSLGSAGTIRMSTGPISMALRLPAALFSLSVFEVEPFTRYSAEIKLLTEETRPARDRGLPHADHAAIAKIARSGRDIILDGIRRHPDQCVFMM